MTSEAISCPGVIYEVKTTSDGGYRLRIDLPELSAEDVTKIMMLKGKIGYFAFAPEEPKKQEFSLELHG